MKHITKSLAALLLAFLLSIPVFAQDTEIPKATEIAPTQEAPTAEATVEPVPVTEPVEPVETVDIHNAWDDFLEAMGKLDVATMALGIGFITMVLQLRKPQTSAERQANDEELARKELEAKQTATQLDDLLVTLSRLANNLRPVADALAASVTPSFTNVSGSADTVVTTTTETTIDNEPELRG